MKPTFSGPQVLLQTCASVSEQTAPFVSVAVHAGGERRLVVASLDVESLIERVVHDAGRRVTQPHQVEQDARSLLLERDRTARHLRDRNVFALRFGRPPAERLAREAALVLVR